MVNRNNVEPSDGILGTIERRAGFLVGLSIVIYSILWLVIVFWKYNNFLYDALDLGIYAQVFWNTSYGRWFQMSVHPQSYLGDHFELFLLLLTPLYSLWRDPRMLLILQTLFVNLVAVPLYFLAKNIFKKNGSIKFPSLLALLITAIYLTNPFTHNALAFEFHLLPFFLLPFFVALYYAERAKLWPFLGALLIALTIREDIAFVVSLAGLSVVLLFSDKIKSRRSVWITAPMIMAVIWFFVAVSIVSLFSPTGEYKFAIYYTPLKGSWQQTFGGIITNSLPIIGRIFRFHNIGTLAGLLMPVSFLPLIAPTALLLMLLPFLEFAMPLVNSAQVLVLHYGVLFLPALMVATIMAINKLTNVHPPLALQQLLARMHWPVRWPMHLGILLLITGSFYSTIVLGPITGSNGMFKDMRIKDDIEQNTLKQAVATINNLPLVISTNRLLPQLSNRENLYTLRYVLAGRQQFTNKPYMVPGRVDALLIDQEDLLRPVRATDNSKVNIIEPKDMANHLRLFIADKNLHPIWSRDGMAIFVPKDQPAETIPLVNTSSGDNANDGILIAPNIFADTTLIKYNRDTADLKIRWRVKKDISQTYALYLQTENEDHKIINRRLLEPGWGLAPTDTWKSNKIITSFFRLSWSAEAKRISFALITIDNNSYQLTDVIKKIDTDKLIAVDIKNP
ncbi:hypothetical protein A3E96_02680 [Candidatus Uhrbacteria bacterium RIFCSPHIGHO2_12_FULL_46_13]|nr:MAG: hypothetical protein A3E96_02680 [Candidatus Uhrbacteria bacterium RIFCSPHIGHO2_12_FULL_46_13]